MSRFYRLLYTIGFAPWEAGMAQSGVAAQIAAMFDREEAEGIRPLGKALDLGCGTGIHAVELARRGWQVTGIDIVPKALDRARERARQAGVEVNLMEGSIVGLDASRVGSGYGLVLDFGTVHGLSESDRRAVGRGVTAVTIPGATLLMLAFKPGRRGPLPRGMSRAEIEATYPGWKIGDEQPQNADLPLFLRKLDADPRWFRLTREM